MTIVPFRRRSACCLVVQQPFQYILLLLLSTPFSNFNRNDYFHSGLAGVDGYMISVRRLAPRLSSSRSHSVTATTRRPPVTQRGFQSQFPFQSSSVLPYHHHHYLLRSSLSTVPKLDHEAIEGEDEDGLLSTNRQKNDIESPYQTAIANSAQQPSSDVSDFDIEQELLKAGIKSRPKSDGTGVWNVQDPLGWTKHFGRRSEQRNQQLEKLIRLSEGDDGYFPVDKIRVPGVTIVRTAEEARKVMAVLMQADEEIFHACDTEVMDIELKKVGPVGNGYVTCVSVFSGPDFDYGLGDGPGTSLWIDNLDDACGVLQEFKEWFENPRFLKVWHNYGFDRHVMWNEGIDVQGFGGDTMHMARLLDSSRAKLGTGRGYSLEALTEDYLHRRKVPMKEIFGIKRLRKDGSEGSLVDIPPVEVMQRSPEHRVKWIEYSCYDAQGTWFLRQKLHELLAKKPWLKGKFLYDYYQMHMRPFGEVLTDMERRGIQVDAKDYLAKVEVQARIDRAHHLEVFHNWAASRIGPDGFAINVASSVQLQTLLFGGAQNQKTQEITEKVRVFKVPREEISEKALQAYEEHAAKEKENGIEEPPDEINQLAGLKVAQLKVLCKERGLKVSGKKADLQERLTEHFLNGPDTSDTQDDFESMTDEELCEVLRVRNISTVGTRKQLLDRIRLDVDYVNDLTAKVDVRDRDGYVALSLAIEEAAKKDGGAILDILEELKEKSNAQPKYIDVTIESLGLKPEKYTAGGAPSVTADVLRALAGDPFADPPKYGHAFEQFGKEGCEALFSLCSIGSIDTMIANFLTSLQELADDQSRVHCSLNLNTETGRLSSRRPNLQNQPALEKDKYQIRRAFQAAPHNNLIVADYGQLELRILASLTDCKSMIDAFALGGDFHSRTALDMFPYIKEKVDCGECLLEWDYSNGDPPSPLLKDMFASERRKAKTLNFSIAYGKTAHGLSKDWGVTPKEAQEMLDAWYDARKEVDIWQQATKKHARDFGETRTVMGRYRQIPEAKGNNRKLLGHAERASINTPIQGGAADIAMMAMNKINDNQKLKMLGWILLLQIHDEVILEGPEETAEEAFEIVLDCMENPWVFGLEKTKVPLTVDGSYTHKNWFDAK